MAILISIYVNKLESDPLTPRIIHGFTAYDTPDKQICTDSQVDS